MLELEEKEDRPMPAAVSAAERVDIPEVELVRGKSGGKNLGGAVEFCEPRGEEEEPVVDTWDC